MAIFKEEHEATKFQEEMRKRRPKGLEEGEALWSATQEPPSKRKRRGELGRALKVAREQEAREEGANKLVRCMASRSIYRGGADINVGRLEGEIFKWSAEVTKGLYDSGEWRRGEKTVEQRMEEERDE